MLEEIFGDLSFRKFWREERNWIVWSRCIKSEIGGGVGLKKKKKFTDNERQVPPTLFRHKYKNRTQRTKTKKKTQRKNNNTWGAGSRRQQETEQRRVSGPWQRRQYMADTDTRLGKWHHLFCYCFLFFCLAPVDHMSVLRLRREKLHELSSEKVQSKNKFHSDKEEVPKKVSRHSHLNHPSLGISASSPHNRF